MMRCFWVNDNPLYIKYHDDEWGVASYDDRYLFEMLILESFQAGLSWECILNKREAFRKAFDYFDFTNNRQIVHSGTRVYTRNNLSDRISKDLKLRGMKFVGTVIIYSYLQAIGIIDDHDSKCFKKR